ncbi:MAG: hypothetical protein EXR58_01685 [Chloroflexi bacterium]|nr:hypothetical protein [Chloroflexota bacterium]
MAWLAIAVMLSACSQGPAVDIGPNGETTVTVTEDSWFGPILTDARGLTLYKPEPNNPNQPDCVGKCARDYPPLTVNGTPSAPADLTGQLTVKARADGARQVVYNGWPLYRDVGDTDPGDTMAHGIVDEWGHWSVISPDEDPPIH